MIRDADKIIRYRNDVILNSKCDFSLKLLKNCNLFDAYNALICARKNETPKINEKIIFRLIKCSKVSLINRSDFYLQKIVINCNLNKKLYLLEDFVAEFCSKKITNNNGWIYIEKINDIWRIIGGIKRGIILSRFLPAHIDIKEEIERTKIYMRRFNLADDFEIFQEISNNINTLIQNKKHIDAIFFKKSEYYQNVVSNIIFGISAIILTICLYIQFLLPEVSKTQNITVHNNYLSAKITTQNFDTINEFIKNIQDSFYPVWDFYRIKKLYPNLNINKISITKDKIEIHTKDNVSISKDIQVINKQGENIICIKK